MPERCGRAEVGRRRHILYTKLHFMVNVVYIVGLQNNLSHKYVHRKLICTRPGFKKNLVSTNFFANKYFKIHSDIRNIILESKFRIPTYLLDKHCVRKIN
jgi:hypothetical protein